MMNEMFRRGVPVVIVLAIVAGMAGCAEDKKTDTSPTLPAAQSMSMDVSFFADVPQAPSGPTTSANFANAAGRVLVINGLFTALMLPPSGAFAIALATTPSRDDDGSWWWIYTWRDRREDFQVRLRGKRNDGRVDWEMYLVRPNQDPWLWYSGSSAEDGSSGDWTFYSRAGVADREVARIEWEYGGPADARLGFSVTDTEVESVGDEIVFTVGGGDHGISFIDASASETWTIDWNTETRAGSLRVPGYNGGAAACWDGSLQDVVCP